jgi:hypothetical protein
MRTIRDNVMMFGMDRRSFLMVEPMGVKYHELVVD